MGLKRHLITGIQLAQFLQGKHLAAVERGAPALRRMRMDELKELAASVDEDRKALEHLRQAGKHNPLLKELSERIVLDPLSGLAFKTKIAGTDDEVMLFINLAGELVLSVDEEFGEAGYWILETK